MTVFVVQEQRTRATGKTYDVTSASDFGQIKFIYGWEDRVSERLDVWVEHAEKVLKDFDKDSDFILWAGGDPTALIVVSALIADITGGTIPQLKWDKRLGQYGEYYPLTVEV